MAGCASLRRNRWWGVCSRIRWGCALKTPDGQFEFSYIRSPKQIAGVLTPFRPTWLVQYLGDGTMAWPDNRRGVFEFVDEFYAICDTPRPAWLVVELSKEGAK